MSEYNLSENKILVVEGNWAAIKENGKLSTKHLFASDWENEPRVDVIDHKTALLHTASDIIMLVVSGTSITVY